MDWFIGKTRRKDKDPSPSQQEETKQYLHSAMLDCSISESKLREIVNMAEGLDFNEWLASHTIAFFEHINLLYGTISEFCSMSGCPDMSGPCNRQYFWLDEKGKRLKLTAPQYVDYVMTFAQKAINDESVFPTKFDKEFPSTFVLKVKRIMKLLYHVVAHIYHSHFKEIVLLNLHPHLNCIFAHMVLFNERFKLIDDKEVEVLLDLAVALKVYPSKKPVQSVPEDTSPSRYNESLEIYNKQENTVTCDENKNNNNMISSEYDDTTIHEDVITTQCRSISALNEYRSPFVSPPDEYMQDQKENRGINLQSELYCVNSPMLVDDDGDIDSKNPNAFPRVSSPEPMMVEPMQSSENTPNKKCVFDIRSSLRERSISANAVLLTASTKSSLDHFPITPITRRSNSDRTSTKSNTALFFCKEQHQSTNLQTGT